MPVFCMIITNFIVNFYLNFSNNFDSSYNTVTEVLKKNHNINGHAVRVNLARPKTAQRRQEQNQRPSHPTNDELDLNSTTGGRNTPPSRQRNDEKNEYSDSNEISSLYGGVKQQYGGKRGNHQGRFNYNRGRPLMRGSTNNRGKLPCTSENNRYLEKQKERENNLYTARFDWNLDSGEVLSCPLISKPKDFKQSNSKKCRQKIRRF